MENIKIYDAVVVGCGLSGSVVARYLAEKGKRTLLLDRRLHIGGNMYDSTDDHGFLVQKYGPHVFHTSKKELFDFICQFESWYPYQLVCGAFINGRYSPVPFNYQTIDVFFSESQAEEIKKKIQYFFKNRKTATVTEILTHSDPAIRNFGEFLFKNDYAPYTAKQWGLSPSEIDPSVLSRVPVRLSYDKGYFDDPYQVFPENSFTHFFENLLNHSNIHIQLGTDALSHISIKRNALFWDDKPTNFPVVYTGALDELFGFLYGHLPYRSLKFEWKYSSDSSIQPDAVVAYPQDPNFTRITEYKKLPMQHGNGSSYVIEYPLAYPEQTKSEPYYPTLTKNSLTLYSRYKKLADAIPTLFYCGRLADFKYYNMDQALERALQVCKDLLSKCI